MVHIAFFETLLLLLLGAVILSLMARHIDVPPAIVLLLGGAALGLVGPVMTVAIEPDDIMVVLIPPLLMSSAFYTAWRDFRRELLPIMSLAAGAVVFTTAAVACAAHVLFSALPWGACIALGAIVSPPDAVAAKALLHRLPIPERLVTVLEGESLINDASGLLIYRFAVLSTMAGTFSADSALVAFPITVIVGVVVGAVFGAASVFVFKWLDDAKLAIVLTFLIAWASYIVGERAHGSGVLSVVTCGLIVGMCQHRAFDAAIRVKATATWDVIVFVLESLVFILIGLSMQGVVARITGTNSLPAVWALSIEWKIVVAVFVAVVGSRFLWALGAMALPAHIIGRSKGQRTTIDFKEATIVGWAGMRGVVSLAAALALPESFPQRDLLVFTTFVVIFTTVILQGLTLRPLTRLLRLRADTPPVPYLSQLDARAFTFGASIAELEKIDLAECGGNQDLVVRLISEYEARVDLNQHAHSGDVEHVQRRFSRLNLGLRAVLAGRRALVELHEQRRIKDTVLRRIEAELDLEELRLRRLLDR
ncbi:Na+/H+ antiporter [Caballeronia sordidicola]|nr:Na+/H+ antiporter [Caballeronia sordidicola]